MRPSFENGTARINCDAVGVLRCHNLIGVGLPVGADVELVFALKRRLGVRLAQLPIGRCKLFRLHRCQHKRDSPHCGIALDRVLAFQACKDLLIVRRVLPSGAIRINATANNGCRTREISSLRAGVDGTHLRYVAALLVFV